MQSKTLTHLHFFVFISDRGPNEVLARKIWQVVARDSPEIVVLSMDCLEHASHLATLGGLKLADRLLQQKFGKDRRGWKYFSSLATTLITLRDLSKELFKQWCNAHGPQSGLKCAKTLWPKCLAGRWNSVSDMETRMRTSGGQPLVLPVLLQILPSKQQGEKRAAAPTDDVDEIAVEESEHYSNQRARTPATTAATNKPEPSVAGGAKTSAEGDAQATEAEAQAHAKTLYGARTGAQTVG